ncbi:hypothetical protein IG193_02625 [Infirmifilum lucidum]|uniref:Uncharacterized protein n=1 Tax=Infirmifilum lucidum TaxID=2776706 RepID=A0A7L9FKN7_9CREN|nr:hypothetical protein [Infirmifilum lucidum]QOJ79375.1 hypothetical protein IG193_02625 [Infirmifilum lucidum]
MDEFTRILFWVWKIGESEKSLVEVSRNSSKAREAIELLQKYSLVKVRKKGRVFLISLSEKGFGVYRKIREMRELIGLDARLVQQAENTASALEPVAPGAGAVPSFLAGNPWLEVLAKRGRERLGL